LLWLVRGVSERPSLNCSDSARTPHGLLHRNASQVGYWRVRTDWLRLRTELLGLRAIPCGLARNTWGSVKTSHFSVSKIAKLILIQWMLENAALLCQHFWAIPLSSERWTPPAAPHCPPRDTTHCPWRASTPSYSQKIHNHLSLQTTSGTLRTQNGFRPKRHKAANQPIPVPSPSIINFILQPPRNYLLISRTFSIASTSLCESERVNYTTLPPTGFSTPQLTRSKHTANLSINLREPIQ